MELSAELSKAARDIGDVACQSEAAAGQVAGAVTTEDALAALLGLIGCAGTLRDMAAGLYVQIIEQGEEG